MLYGVIVRAWSPGIYGSKPTQSPRTRSVYVAIESLVTGLYIPSDLSIESHRRRHSSMQIQGYLGNDRFEKLLPWPVLSLDLPPGLACASGLTWLCSKLGPSVKAPPPALLLVLLCRSSSLTATPHFSEFVSDDELSNDF